MEGCTVVYIYGGDVMDKRKLVGNAWRYDSFLGTWMMNGNAIESPVGIVAYEDAYRDPLSLLGSAIRLKLSLLVVFGGGMSLMRPSVRFEHIYCYEDLDDRRELECLVAMHWLSQQFSMYED